MLQGQRARQALPAGIDPGDIKLDGPALHPSRPGLWPVPFEDDAIPASIAEFVGRLRSAAAALDLIASDSRISGAGVVDRVTAIKDRHARGGSFRSLYHIAVAMSDDEVRGAMPPVMSSHNPLAPMIDSGELREWASSVEDGAGWARGAALRLSNQADYTDALMGAGAAEAV